MPLSPVSIIQHRATLQCHSYYYYSGCVAVVMSWRILVDLMNYSVFTKITKVVMNTISNRVWNESSYPLIFVPPVQTNY